MPSTVDRHKSTNTTAVLGVLVLHTGGGVREREGRGSPVDRLEVLMFAEQLMEEVNTDS